MRGLTIIIATDDEDRFRSALGLALSGVALGGRARLFLDSAAVPIVRSPVMGGEDATHTAHGLPTLAELIGEALDAGVEIILCQAGLAMAGATTADFEPRIGFGGMIGLLAGLGEDRLVVA